MGTHGLPDDSSTVRVRTGDQIKVHKIEPRVSILTPSLEVRGRKVSLDHSK